jgi:hypothetical protein
MDMAIGSELIKVLVEPILKPYNDLKAFVQHRGRIHRDFSAHAPVRVRTGLFGRNLRQVSPALIAKWPARSGEDQATYPRCRPRWRTGSVVVRQALKNGVVFTINRQKLGPCVTHSSHEDRTCRHQGLFVGKQHAFTGLCRSQGGWQTGRANNRGHNRLTGGVTRDLY